MTGVYLYNPSDTDYQNVVKFMIAMHIIPERRFLKIYLIYCNVWTL